MSVKIIPAVYKTVRTVLAIVFTGLVWIPVFSRPFEVFHDPGHNIHFRQYTVDEGLSQNLVSAIYQDHSGFVWVGTKNGLNLFNSYEFRIFKHDPFDPYSISDNYITVIFEDRENRLWIGTMYGGLNLFDRTSGRFTRFMRDPANQNTITKNHIISIADDINGNLWVGTHGGGLIRMNFAVNNPTSDNVVITRFNDHISGFPEENASVQALYFDEKGYLWAGTQSRILRVNKHSGEPEFTEYRFEPGGKESLSGSRDLNRSAGARCFFEDSSNQLWMVNIHGLFYHDSLDNVFKEFIADGRRVPVTNITSAVPFNNGKTEEFWITSGDEIFVVNPVSGKYSVITYKTHKNYGLQKGRYIRLFADNHGSLWIGSNGYGLSLYSPGSVKFRHPEDFTTDEEADFIFSSRDLSMRSFYKNERNPDVLWLGANQGLFRVNRLRSALTRVKLNEGSDPINPIVYSIKGDDNGYLWIGSRAGLTRLDTHDNSLVHYPTGLDETSEGTGSRVSHIHLTNNEVWILTHRTLARLNQVTGEFDHIWYDDTPIDELSEDLYPSLFEDRYGNFWLACHNGIFCFDRGSWTLSKLSSGNDGIERLLETFSKTILPDPEDPDRFLWIGFGGGGIIRFDLLDGHFEHFTEAHGLANDMVYGLLSDRQKNIWISTNRGLSRFNTNEKIFINYNTKDGLQSNEFNSGAYYLCSSGEMFFGGINGYNSFFPVNIIHREVMVPVVVTGMTILSGDSKENITLSLYLSDLKEPVSLRHNQNSFTISFASLDYSNPAGNTFAYSMTRFGENWIETGQNHEVIFNDLNPGLYTLRVRGTNSDGVWSDHEAVLKVAIAAPWWGQTWAYLIYMGIIMAVILGFRKYEITRIILKNRMRLAYLETAKLKELDHLKSRFIANISHEFRTPLTLIKGPLEQLAVNEKDIGKRQSIELIRANTRKLLKLINQLLELSKIENNHNKLRVGRGDITGFLRGLTMSFASLSAQKSVRLIFEVDPATDQEKLNRELWFDPDILEKIVNNLLSNAIKFTPENGTVRVGLSVLMDKDQYESLTIIVSDTGIGIPPEELPHIFGRFYKGSTGEAFNREGSGIGLAFVRELARMHNTEISVESNSGAGTSFFFSLPIGLKHYPADRRTEFVPVSLKVNTNDNKYLIDRYRAEDHLKEGELSEAPLILIVEDHSEVSRFISERLGNEYRVIEAAGVRQGIAIAEDLVPDLVLSDLMMPEADGYEFCRQLKNSILTSHIPVVLLTARADEEDRIRGLEAGADDYLTKPFNFTELKARIKNLILSRQELRQKFSTRSIVKPGSVTVTQKDTEFMKKLIKVVEQNISNPQFSVEDLGRAVGMSKSQIHRKLKAVINIPANKFIRTVRMHRAMELLHGEKGNVSEVAYMVGYDDPGYFAKAFRLFFGKPPSEVIRNSE